MRRESEDIQVSGSDGLTEHRPVVTLTSGQERRVWGVAWGARRLAESDLEMELFRQAHRYMTDVKPSRKDEFSILAGKSGRKCRHFGSKCDMIVESQVIKSSF